MAKYTKAVSITFNDNDGGLSYSVNPESADDLTRHYKMFGKWKARFMFCRMFWKGLNVLQGIATIKNEVKND